MKITNVPGLMGVIDGTHIRIVVPRESEQEYINRKNFHSINIQLFLDSQYRILDALTQWPGSVHDSRIFNECGLKEDFEMSITPGGCHLIADNGCPCQLRLLTPILQPRDAAQEAYNWYGHYCLVNL